MLSFQFQAILWLVCLAFLQTEIKTEQLKRHGYAVASSKASKFSQKKIKSIEVMSELQCHHSCTAIDDCSTFATEGLANGKLNCILFRKTSSKDDCIMVENHSYFEKVKLRDVVKDEKKATDGSKTGNSLYFKERSVANYATISLAGNGNYDDFTICFKFTKTRSNPGSDYAIFNYKDDSGSTCDGIIVTEKSLTIQGQSGGLSFVFAPDTLQCIQAFANGISYFVSAYPIARSTISGNFYGQKIKKGGTMVIGQMYNQAGPNKCNTFNSSKSFVGKIQLLEMWGRSDLDITSLVTAANHDGDVISWETLLKTVQLFGNVIKEV
eukprot:Seg1567.4_Seg1567.5 transcript_id=Seg1567.4_Seg1567.5/GoldUCD/mRNA.D3Y31 product="hypothetical protein" protein_id=Seg1567.4_Seg1567.5/GoldUCD/D3Y31